MAKSSKKSVKKTTKKSAARTDEPAVDASAQLRAALARLRSPAALAAAGTLAVDDRVNLRVEFPSTPPVAVGTCGTVLATLGAIVAVQFDGDPIPRRLVLASDLRSGCPADS